MVLRRTLLARFRALTAAAVVAAPLAIAGCSSDPATPAIDAAVDTGVDTGSDEEVATDTGAADTGRPDPWDGGEPSAECVAHCECMLTNCSKYSRYPYADARACTDHCGHFTAPELACWSYFCGEGGTATSNNEHWCEHAWGTWGLEECP
jgi:hypothetical protein